nr:hypothetical protein CFP56_23282 [Quercus suber]
MLITEKMNLLKPILQGKLFKDGRTKHQHEGLNVESVSHETSPPVLLDEGCPDINGQASKGGNFESQHRDINRELTKFDTPSTPHLDTSSALNRVEAPLPSSRAPLDYGETSTTSVQPPKLSTSTRFVRTTVDGLTLTVLVRIGGGMYSFVPEEDCSLLPCKRLQVLRSDEEVPTLLVKAVKQPHQNQ